MKLNKSKLFEQNWSAIALATIVLCVCLSIASPAFMSLTNMQSVLVQASVTAIMAIGMTYIIIGGGIDISVGAILFFISSVFAELVVASGSYPFALGVSLTAGVLLGALNGFLSIRFNVTPLITTLATYTIYRGMAIHLTGAQNIPIPREIGYLGNGSMLGIPVPIWLMVLVTIMGVYLIKKTRFGLYLRAVGSSEESAHESGLPIMRVTVLAYLIGGCTAALAGLILIARVGGLQSDIGIGLEFTVIAAVILGGTKLSGGSGTVVGSVIGAIFLVLIDNGLNMLNASPYVYDTVRGVVLLVAVIVDRLSEVRTTRSLIKSSAIKMRGAEN
ncbi:ABC transporter permease [Paraglaciecola aquimarina]|uniref:ABC transporter permease n=1 Tax=Paraglaciecola aquimarina TaxID=1235557 RepID=A0ABU3SY56_9ALTE|nr:ABC transporter permease [Paraglaciecola aquimarina]MDU0354940.1 ABC transporter permease [Paraglaciecola aquimarina]